MAGTDPQRQLLTLIRNFTSEKSQGERRVVELKKRIEELRCEVDAANAELEEVKRFKETIEQDLKGCKLQLALTDASIQTTEARISVTEDEVFSIRSEIDALKNEEGASRDAFISHMFTVNAEIRKFQEENVPKSQTDRRIGTAAEADCKAAEEVVIECDLRALEDMLTDVASETNKEELEYQAEENFLKQVQKEYVDLQRKVSLMEDIMKKTKALQELTRQTSELEQNYASLGEELQKRCLCPSCHADNVEALGGILQGNEAN